MFVVTYTIMLFGSTAVALWRGGRPERVTAVMLFLASFATPVLEASRYESVEVGLLGLDIVILAVLGTFALKGTRFWPLWAGGFQLASTMLHLARWLDPSVLPAAYAWAEAFWSYPIQSSLLIGTLYEVPRRR